MYNQQSIKISQNNYLDRDYYIGGENGAIVNAGIGTALTGNAVEIEIEKAKVAIEAGASMVTDHSICGDIREYHRILRQCVHVPLCAVPVYELALQSPCFSDREAINIIEEYLNRGFNVLTLHCTVLKEDVGTKIADKRLIPMTSKGGRVILKRMALTGIENPFYSHFNEILQLFKKHNAVISLGPAYRPASVGDNFMDDNDPYWIETNRMSKLIEQAIKLEVPIIVEGIGHARMDMIPYYVKRSKEICYQVPYRVLSVSTDIALGYDNISSAIASSIAVLNGANVVTAVTPSEHIGLPSIKDVEDGVISAKIAIHSAEICIKNCINKDIQMSKERSQRANCQGSISHAIFPKGAEQALRDRKFKEGCSMCGVLCALRQDADK